MIIAGFPALGKKDLAAAIPQFISYINYRDFKTKKGNDGEELPNENYVEDYISAVAAKDKLGVLTLVNQDKAILDGFEKRNMQYAIVIPHPSIKADFVDGMRKRGIDEARVKEVEDNYDAWVKEQADKVRTFKFVLAKGDSLAGTLFGFFYTRERQATASSALITGGAGFFGVLSNRYNEEKPAEEEKK